MIKMASKITGGEIDILISNMRQLDSHIVKGKIRVMQYVGLSFKWIRGKHNLGL